MTIDIQYDFSGQAAIVTGGAQGIGRTVATQLVKFGAQVWIWDINPVELDGAHSMTVDVTKGDQILKALAHVVDHNSQIDILVNNAGYLGSYQPFEQFDSSEWQRIVQVNLIGVLEVTRQVLPVMRRAGHGRIVNMGSLAGKEGLPSLAVYSAASAGIIAFTKALSREVCDTDIRVNCVAPGPIDTELINRLGPEVVEAMITASPLKRLGSVDEVAGLVLWLCSPASSFNTGACSTCPAVARDIESSRGGFSMATLADVLVRQLLDGRHVASLATENPDGSIHMVAVWFWFDGTYVYVATSSRSRKARNLQSNPKVSLMIDSRDPVASYGITIAGTAQILTADVSRKSNAEIHRKYLSEAALADARVGPVFAAWDDVTIQIAPASVIAWDMREADRQFFGGVLGSNPAYLLALQS